MDFDIKNTDLKHLEMRVRKIEHILLLMQKSGIRGHKLTEIALWIKEIVKEHKSIRVEKLKIMALKKGYSWQMVQRARRELLSKTIETVQRQGWRWKYVG